MGKEISGLGERITGGVGAAVAGALGRRGWWWACWGTIA